MKSLSWNDSGPLQDGWRWIRPLFDDELITDVHIKGEGCYVRRRGVIEDTDISVSQSFIQWLLETYGQDASFGFDDVRIRMHILGSINGYDMAVRVLPRRIPPLEQLGLPPVFSELIQLKRGLVLVTGAVGSGKTTTLGSLIQAINEVRPVNIITIEDPVELIYTPIKARFSQREIGGGVSTYPQAIRDALREDPDVVLVGETRDPEALEAVMTLAETGKLVFTTLHSIDVAQTFHRILDSFPAHKQPIIRAQCSMVIQAVVSQVLVPTINGDRAVAQEFAFLNEAIRNIIRSREDKLHLLYPEIESMEKQGDTHFRTFTGSFKRLVSKGQITLETARQFATRPRDFPGG